jgi:hypothetical protein
MKVEDREIRIPTTTEENIKYGLELSDDKVSIHGEKYTDIPQWIGQQYPNIKELTICACEITYVVVESLLWSHFRRTINNLSKFTKLVILVLDNNNIGDDNEFSFIPTLETFWVNNNKVCLHCRVVFDFVNSILDQQTRKVSHANSQVLSMCVLCQHAEESMLSKLSGGKEQH